MLFNVPKTHLKGTTLLLYYFWDLPDPYYYGNQLLDRTRW